MPYKHKIDDSITMGEMAFLFHGSVQKIARHLKALEILVTQDYHNEDSDNPYEEVKAIRVQTMGTMTYPTHYSDVVRVSFIRCYHWLEGRCESECVREVWDWITFGEFIELWCEPYYDKGDMCWRHYLDR